MARGIIEESSASGFLAGSKFDGGTIKKILKGRGGLRRIMFVEDRKPANVHRSTIHELAALKGTIEYRHKLLNAPTLAARRNMVKRSRDRQFALLRRAVERMEQGAKDAPPTVARQIRAHIGWLTRQKFGSPILGERPASTSLPERRGAAKVFSTAARTNVRFRTITIRGKKRVIPYLVD